MPMSQRRRERPADCPEVATELDAHGTASLVESFLDSALCGIELTDVGAAENVPTAIPGVRCRLVWLRIAVKHAVELTMSD